MEEYFPYDFSRKLESRKYEIKTKKYEHIQNEEII